MQAFQEDLDKFKRLNAQVLGVSGDSLETHARFTEKYSIAFPLASDQDGTIKSLYGRNRITYLIDSDGVIRFIQHGVPKNSDFLKALKGIEDQKK